jgi:Bacterial membrane protein YfhO
MWRSIGGFVYNAAMWRPAKEAVVRAGTQLRRHPGLLAFGFLVVLIGWLFFAALLGGKRLGPEDLLLFQSPFAPADVPAGWHPSNTFLFDVVYVFHPDMLYAREALRSFSLPTWNPYIGAGEPLLASQQNAILFPLNWLAIVAPSFWSSLAWVAALKLFAAGGGMLLFLRTLRLRWPAALLGAVAFAFNAYLVDWLEHDLSNAWTILPWLFLFATLLARNRRPRDALLLGAAFGADFLGGHPETSFMAVTAAVPWFFVLLAFDRASFRGDLRALARVVGLFIGSLVLGSVLAAIVYVPFVEMLGQSTNLVRGGGDGSANWLFGFVAPELWGRPDKAEIAGGPLSYIERTAYFGVIPVIFAFAGVAARRCKEQIFFVVIGLLSLGLVIYVPVYSHLVGRLPVLDRIDQFRYLGIVAFCGAALAAYGMQHLLLETSRRRRVAMVAVGALVAGLPLLWVVAHHTVLHSFGAALEQLPNIQREPIPRAVLQLAAFLRWGLFALVGVILLAIGAFRPRLAMLAGVLAIAVTGYDLVTYDHGFHPAIPASFDEISTPAALSTIKQLGGHQRVAGGVEFLPNLAERYQLRDARVYELPELERRTELWGALGGATGGDEVMNPEDGLLASVFSVRYMLSYTLTEQLLHATHPSQWRLLSPQPLVENREALPRAWIAYGWRAASNMDAALTLIKAPGSTARVDMRSPTIEGVPSAPAGEAPAAEPAHFLRDGTKAVSIEVEAHRPGYVVLNDTYYPGWSATVNGHAATIHPANVAFRAVAVPAGHDVITFHYDPLSVKIGAIVSLFGVVVLVGGLLAPPLWRRRRRHAY